MPASSLIWVPPAAGLALFAGLAAGAAPPANDLFANRAVLSGESATVQGSNTGAAKETSEPNHAGDAGGKSVWWTWTAPFSGSVIITTEGSNFDTLLAVYTGGSVSSLTLAAANDQDPFGIETDTSRVKFDAILGVSYEIAVDGWRGDSGTVALNITPPPRPPNDRFETRAALSGPLALAEGTTFDASKEPGEPDHAGEPGGHSVWWTWTAPFGGSAILTTESSDFDTVLAVYQGQAVDDLILVAANDQDPLGGDASRVLFNTVAGAAYEIAVDGWNGNSGIAALRIDLRPREPSRFTGGRPLSNGRVQATVRGLPGQLCVVQARSAPAGPAPWTAVATNYLDRQGQWNFTDAQAASFITRFYRARTWP